MLAAVTIEHKMDSFSILFSFEVLSNEIMPTLAMSLGAQLFNTSEHRFSVVREGAQIWASIRKRSELALMELGWEGEWPLPEDQVRSIVDILVRRNQESDDLALEVAHYLACTLGGAISWDGMDYWEHLYETRYPEF